MLPQPFDFIFAAPAQRQTGKTLLGVTPVCGSPNPTVAPSPPRREGRGEGRRGETRAGG